MKQIRPLLPWSVKTTAQMARDLDRLPQSAGAVAAYHALGLNPGVLLTRPLVRRLAAVLGPHEHLWSPPCRKSLALRLRSRYPRNGRICAGSSYSSRKMEGRLSTLLKEDWVTCTEFLHSVGLSPVANRAMNKRNARLFIARYLGFRFSAQLDQLFGFFSVPLCGISRADLAALHVAMRQYLNLDAPSGAPHL